MKKILLAILFPSLLIVSLSSCGSDDECEEKTFYQDLDGDGLGNPNVSVKGCEAPSGFVEDNTDTDDNGIPTKVLNSNITTDTELFKDTVYVLASRVYVENGAELKINPGTIIKGDAGTGANSKALIVTRGSTIDAVGTATEPIIFTSTTDQISPVDIAAGNFESPNLDAGTNGLWGGVIILGNAEISASSSEVQIEGIPAAETGGLYGGSNNSESSGKFKFVSIRHGGTSIGSGNEINGLTLGGVGSGTEISDIEIVANQDDGIEWFGGTVDLSNVVIWNAGDDALDTDQGWSGTCSNFIIVTPQGSAFELDGPEGTPLSTGNHTFTNGTIYAGDLGGALVDLDDNTNVNMDNLYFYGIENNVNGVESIAAVAAAGGVFGDWEYTIDASFDAATIFNDVPSAALTSVAENANTVGVTSAASFSWTWAAQSGGLSSIGL